MIGARNVKLRYKLFVESWCDEEIANVYQNDRLRSILGSDDFINSITSYLENHPEIPETKTLRPMIGLDQLVQLVANALSVEKPTILASKKGRGQKNEARSAAIYLSRKYAGYSLNEIAEYFG